MIFFVSKFLLHPSLRSLVDRAAHAVSEHVLKMESQRCWFEPHKPRQALYSSQQCAISLSPDAPPGLNIETPPPPIESQPDDVILSGHLGIGYNIGKRKCSESEQDSKRPKFTITLLRMVCRFTH